MAWLAASLAGKRSRRHPRYARGIDAAALRCAAILSALTDALVGERQVRERRRFLHAARDAAWLAASQLSSADKKVRLHPRYARGIDAAALRCAGDSFGANGCDGVVFASVFRSDAAPG